MTGGHARWATVFLLLATVAIAAPVLSQAEDADASVDNVTYVGEAAVDVDTNESLVWRQGPHQVDVTVSSDAGLSGGSVCLSTVPGNDTSAADTAESELACQSVSVSAGETATATVEFDAWPVNRTGAQSVRAVVHPADGERVLDEAETSFTVLERDGDVDGDGLTNEREVSAGTGLWIDDTDEDGLTDGLEVNTYETDPASNDTDGDGLVDRTEIREYQTDPTASDTDGDGLLDGLEIANGTSPNVADTDGDGLDDALELNTYGTNASNPDTDGDGLDDGSEVRDHGTNPTSSDTDGDGLADNLEIHTYETDPNAIDTDGDGLQDGVEVEEYRTDPTEADTDGDGLDDGAEVNTYQTNPKRADTDGDGLDDAAEANRFETDPLSADTDGDGVSDPQEVDRSQFASPGFLLQIAIVGVVLLVLGGMALQRSEASAGAAVTGVLPTRFNRYVGDAAGAADATSGTDPGSDELRSDPLEVPSGQDDAPSDATDTDTAGATTDTARTPSDSESSVDSEEVDFDLMPNTEVVLTVLEDHDGQIHQAKLVDETGWSKAKVSRVLSRMESDEEIVKVSVGRGNLVTTPDEVPPGVRSPFEE